MARKKAPGKAGRKSAPRKTAWKAPRKPGSRAAGLGPEQSIAKGIDAVSAVIKNLKALQATSGAEAIQGQLTAAINSLENAGVTFEAACRRVRKVLDY
jgi:hypothetical protein